MDLNDVDDMLAYLWSSTLEDFKVNFSNHELILKARSGQHQFDVVIGGVVGFTWANSHVADEEVRQDTAPWDYTEVTSASTEDDCRVDVSSAKRTSGHDYFLNGLYIIPNLAFELWNSVLLVEAKTVEVNGKVFVVKES